MNAIVETIIAPGSEVSGRVVVGDLALLGRFKGDVQAEGSVRIGAEAQVEAQVQATNVQVSGRFEGQIRATVLTFGQGARARGTFFCERLLLSDGAVVDGAFNIDEPVLKSPPVAAPQTKKSADAKASVPDAKPSVPDAKDSAETPLAEVPAEPTPIR